MHKSVQPAAKKAKVEDESRKENECKSKKNNGTMVETFKYLNYCQLAKNGLVTKRFRNMIQTHRHTLAILYVRNIDMYSFITPAAMKVFDKQLSPEAYNEWIAHNGYSKQVPLKDQVASTQSAQNIPDVYQLDAHAFYKGPSHRKWVDKTSVFFACTKLNDDSWPVFQHFVRLVTDPFIYIGSMNLIYKNDAFLDLLAGEFTPDRSRLQCEKLTFRIGSNNQKSITWTKNHVRCDRLCIYGEADLHQDALLDLFVTGSHCTSAIEVRNYVFSKVLVDFVQLFLDLESCDEYHGVPSIEGYTLVKDQDIQILKKSFIKFLVKEERNDRSILHVFEIINNAIRKKLQLTAAIFDRYTGSPVISVKIFNL
ncbi:hypothetical protein DdX_11271 [Ditylenchus destructor]|uniref:Uncharacterized protein n=1 Tax=Ditylenchus destructor TaxID=166010 RepID=A0AAD4N2K9_9BILA|nr:hypothetical protein DdX_11271 [Ditylenchus destructor]